MSWRIGERSSRYTPSETSSRRFLRWCNQEPSSNKPPGRPSTAELVHAAAGSTYDSRTGYNVSQETVGGGQVFDNDDEYDEYCVSLDSDDLAAIDRATAASLRRQSAAHSKTAHPPTEDDEFDEYFISLGSEDYAIVDSATAAPH
ncbi:hypothetical protein OIV83_005011 [Microbotryomycetes sp. JL201]|nr:hypothetical protein OIV83_005011 [Microbotryomycetes sp. JL201]